MSESQHETSETTERRMVEETETREVEQSEGEPDQSESDSTSDE